MILRLLKGAEISSALVRASHKLMNGLASEPSLS